MLPVIENLETDADYANFPVATSEADIWNLLTPFGLTFTLDKLEYDLILWLDVAWPILITSLHI